jgi:predicted RNA-binding protein
VERSFKINPIRKQMIYFRREEVRLYEILENTLIIKTTTTLNGMD